MSRTATARATASAASVSFGGTVSFRDPATGVYTVSAPGVSLLVRGGAQRKPPELGDKVEVEARIADNATEPLPVRPAGREGCGRPPALPKPPKTALEQVGTVHTGAAADEIADEGTDAATETTTDVEAIVEGVCRRQPQADRQRRRPARVGPRHPARACRQRSTWGSSSPATS